MKPASRKIKVCGLTQTYQAQSLTDSGIDFLGFIFYEKSPRFVLNSLSLKEIAEIPHLKKVGVFVNEELDKIVEIANDAHLNLIQLHGDEDRQFIIDLKTKSGKNIEIIKVIRIGNQNQEELQNVISQFSETPDYFLFDTDSSAFGGTGKTFDWRILSQTEIPKPFFLSGGISLENIGEIKTINQKPFALDINSKFEIEPGIKNLEKIKSFQNTLRNHDL